jgi:hypothetical protein
MGLRARILTAVHHEGGGPRPRRLLEAMARTELERRRASKIVDAMIEKGELEMYGERRGARYGLPRARR